MNLVTSYPSRSKMMIMLKDEDILKLMEILVKYLDEEDLDAVIEEIVEQIPQLDFIADIELT